MRILKDNVLVRVSEAERRKMFEKPITRDDGSVVNLIIGIQAEHGFEDVFAQAVSIGEVVMVGSNVTDMEVGDLVLLDYIVDTMLDIIVSKNDEEKVVCLDTKSEFYDRTYIVDANRRTPQPTIVYNKGEMKSASLIIAYIRGDNIYTRWPYVLLEHVAPKSEFEMKGKFFEVAPEEEGMTERTILLPSDRSRYRTGQRVACQAEHLYSRELNGKKFDVIFDGDIAGIIN